MKLTEEQKQQTMDFIFGKREDSPLKRDKNGKIISWKNKEGLENVSGLANEHSGMKLCKHCGEVKPIEEFYNMNAAIDGLQRHCKTCQLERAHLQAEAKRKAKGKQNDN